MPSDTILAVDDEVHILELISFNLKAAGYHVVTALTGEEALKRCEVERPSLVLLDIMLPGLDGYALLDYLRPQGVPVIFLTAKAAVKDRVLGLRLGADDYIVKPFAMDELMARMEMVLRRAGKGGHQLQAFDVTLDSAAHMVLQRGQPVELTPREFALLEQLMRNRGAAIYRDTLMERAWGGDAETTRAVDTYITRLRKKLNWGDKIETVYQIGYRLKQE